MKPSTARFSASGILMIWGIVLLSFCVSGRITAYLHPTFHPFALISGVVLVALSAGVLFFGADTDPVGCGDGVFPGGWFSLLVLTLPLLAATFISPSRYGASAIENRGIVDEIKDLPAFQKFVEPVLPNEDGSVSADAPGDVVPFLKKNDEGYIKAETVDLLYAASQAAMRGDFENKDVELTGQFMPSRTGNPTGNRFRLIRLFVMCCAADAQSVAVMVQPKSPTDFSEMIWVKVRGKATFPLEGGKHVPLITDALVTEIDAPLDAFTY
jgi:uncharacterized repeat protein (TIGR03943 family)